MSTTYQLNLANIFSMHTAQLPAVVEDIDSNHLELDAAVQSGDYFASIATTLDTVSLSLSGTDRYLVEKLVNDLLYLQAAYTISRKPQP